MAYSVTILVTRQIPSADPARVGKMDYAVTYRVDGGPAEYVTLPKDAPTEAEITAAIAAKLKTRGALVGKTLTIP